jgi:hypothetical protein
VQLAQHPVLGAEVVHDRALADAELTGEVTEIRAVVAPFGDRAGERVQDLRAATVATRKGAVGDDGAGHHALTVRTDGRVWPAPSR